MQVARAADAALDALAAGSEEWAASVRRLKFEAYNHEWLQLVLGEEAGRLEGGGYGSGSGAGACLAPMAGEAATEAGQPMIGAFWGPPAA